MDAGAMRVWYCTDHDGHWPVGSASVVVAEYEDQARAYLIEALREKGIHQPKGDFTLTELPLDAAKAVVLNDGEY